MSQAIQEAELCPGQGYTHRTLAATPLAGMLAGKLLPPAWQEKANQEPKRPRPTLLRHQVQRVALEWSCYGYRRVTAGAKAPGPVQGKP